MHENRLSAGFIAGVIAISLWIAGTLLGAAQAKTINVPGGKPTIQAAIDATVNGDVVVVSARRYVENLNFNGKAITVRSTNPNSPAVVAATIIDGNQSGSVVVFKSGETSTSVLAGFTLTNGSGTLNWVLDAYGGGVYCNGASPTLTKNTITGNSAAIGGGLECGNHASPILTGNTISGNSARIQGGGLRCGGYSSPTMTNNTISENSAGDNGGGLYCYDHSSPTLTGNTLSDNSSDASGGGVYCCGYSSPDIASNTVRGNTAVDDGGGVSCYDHSSPALTSNTIYGNSTSASGGGVYCYTYASPKLTSNTIRNNTAVNGGGGLECNNYSSPALTNNTIYGNSVGNGYGGGVMCYDNAFPTLTNNTISRNSANLGGGGVCCAHDSSPILKNTIVALNNSGGGLYAYVDPAYPSDFFLTYCDVYGNAGGNYVHSPSQTGTNGNLSKDPLFANAAKGDFHEKSKGGRWNPATKTWVKDTVQSPCINKGDPASPFALEPAPNGGRINMGAYGNTAQASKSAPKVATGDLLMSAAAAPASGGGAQLSVNLSAAASVAVTITNLAGRAVAALPESDLPQGMNSLLWSGRSASGTKAPAGRYLVRVTARSEGGSQTQVLVSLSLSR